jgi:2-methylcitrate dehydratase
MAILDSDAAASGGARGTDDFQSAVAAYAGGLRYADLTPAALRAARIRIIDTIGALYGGLAGEPARIARRLARRAPDGAGATIVGTGSRVIPELAAFANGTAARYVELNDAYHWPGSLSGHPSDVIMPLLAAADETGASGREFLVAVVAAYEVYLRTAHRVRLPGFDYTNLALLGGTAGVARLYRLSPAGIRDALALAVIPNNALRQTRVGDLTMWKAAASGQAARSAVFAASLARAGMSGPVLPFEGGSGWFSRVAGPPAAAAGFARAGGHFLLQDTILKPLSCCGTTISSGLAAIDASARIAAGDRIEKVLVQTYRRAKEEHGTAALHWKPETRETADHSVPYVVAVGLLDGAVGPRQFDDAHLRDPRIADVMDKTEVVEVPEFTRDYLREPPVHRTRVVVSLAGRPPVAGETGGTRGDLSDAWDDAAVELKFAGLAGQYLAADRIREILDRWWAVDQAPDVRPLVSALSAGLED